MNSFGSVCFHFFFSPLSEPLFYFSKTPRNARFCVLNSKTLFLLALWQGASCYIAYAFPVPLHLVHTPLPWQEKQSLPERFPVPPQDEQFPLPLHEPHGWFFRLFITESLSSFMPCCNEFVMLLIDSAVLLVEELAGEL